MPVKPKKHLGQHFLRDENIARKIIGYLDPIIPEVLEIGPGTGMLSRFLLADERFRCHFMEIDAEAADYLEITFPEIRGRLLRSDFLSSDLSRFHHTTLLGNFPYNISSQILFRVLENRNSFPLVIGMFQKEVAERIAAPPGNKTYGILSVLTRAWYDIDYLFTVGEKVFFPPPRVKSAVIRLRRNNQETLGCDERFFITVVKAAFNQRRKTLRNALRTIAGNHPLAGFADKRAEQLTVEDFIRLTLDLQQTIGEKL